MGNQSEQLGGQTTSSLMMNDGGATNMMSGAPSHDTMEASATKRGDDGKMGGGDNFMRSSPLNKKS
jgi:hypothetical protein